MNRTAVSLKHLLAAVAITVPVAAGAQTFKMDKFDIAGTGGTDYLTAEAGTGRVFVSRTTHVMVIDGPTGKVLGDIPNPGRNHGIALSAKSGHGFITAGGSDSAVVMFDLTSLAVLKTIKIPTGGLDGIMYDDYMDRIVLTNHSKVGTVVILDANSGDIVGTVNLDGNGPEGAASDGKGKLFVNLEDKNEIQVIDSDSMKSVAIWSTAPCDGPTGIAMDRASNRIFSGCGETSVVTDAISGKVVAQIKNGAGVDALGWDDAEKLIYIPSSAGNVTVVHEDTPDTYTVVATVKTIRGAKTIAVDPAKHMAYIFTAEYGPAPAPAAGTPPPATPPAGGGRGGPPRGPLIGQMFGAISH